MIDGIHTLGWKPEAAM